MKKWKSLLFKKQRNFFLQTGRIDVTAGRVTGHHGPILDLQWNPFNDNIIASSSDDCTVCLLFHL